MFMEIDMYKRSSESGFALLITIIVVGVVLSVGLAVLDLSIKQVRLSTNAKESEVAFHAANAGMECALYWRRKSSPDPDMEDGDNINPSCFAVSAGTIEKNNGSPGLEPVTTGDGVAYMYEYDFPWGPVGDVRCTQVNTLVGVADILGGGLSITNMTDLFPGYPDGDTLVCDAGTRCTVVSSLGYNKPCSTINTSYGVVQREVLLQF